MGSVAEERRQEEKGQYEFQCLHCGCSFSINKTPHCCPGCGELESFYNMGED